MSDQKSPTGSLRKNGGKPQMSNISPQFILDLAALMTKATEKYPVFNWAKGNYMSVPYDSCMRHLLAFNSGENNDPETGLGHLAHAAANIMFMHYYLQNFPEMDDRFFKKNQTEVSQSQILPGSGLTEYDLDDMSKDLASLMEVEQLSLDDYMEYLSGGNNKK